MAGQLVLTSVCDSQPTIPSSRFDNGSAAFSILALLRLDVRFVAIRDSLLFALDLEEIRCNSLPFSPFWAPLALIDASDC